MYCFISILEALYIHPKFKLTLCLHKMISVSLSHNHFHNILRLFDVLPNFPFTTSEAMCDYYLWTWYIQVSSRVAERLKIYEIRKCQESVKVSWNSILVPSLPVKMKILLIIAKNSWKTKNNFSHNALFHTKTRVSLRQLVNDCRSRFSSTKKNSLW